MEFREAIDRDVKDLRDLADRIAASSRHTSIGTNVLAGLAACGNDFLTQERQLDAAAWSLRKSWLALAHRPADESPKSPCAGQSAHVAAGSQVDFGYERDLDVSLLEQRRIDYMQSADGWSTDLVLCRSGQAALGGLLQFAIGQWGTTGPLRIAHKGAYFETASLLDAWPDRVLKRVADNADVAIAEPVWCDGRFGCTGTDDAPRRALFLDTTMAGPAYDVTPHLTSGCPLVVAYSSGLKLDQAGLELANVGIVRIYGRRGREDARKVAESLRRIRALTGTGLTLDELSALSAPWFMDRDYVDRYATALFANNRSLAESIGHDSPIFGSQCHPSLVTQKADAPFCAIELREPSPERYEALSQKVEAEIERRGLLASRGGSFGFRGHRFELIEPEAGQGRTFLRVALGWRDGHSRQGLCDLFAELAEQGFSPAGT
jgi:hypothetical protein